MADKDMGDTDISEFIRIGGVGSYRFFIGKRGAAASQVLAHVAARRRGKRVKCSSYLAVANGLNETVKLVKVEITQVGAE